ncbi:magnesium transporter [Liquorilactobacillus sicerae]|uniref:magnesium transporter n=1 Tax=Liquorilactobacillus sicerae TaxID=1416943 RepID=UPI0024803760|nr:magnesium transporter [Liquorilactobacillus sicerae]
MTEVKNNNQIKQNKFAKLLDSQSATRFQQIFLKLHVYQQAQIITELDLRQRQRLYRYLTAHEVAEAFNELEDKAAGAKYMAEMTPKYAAKVISSMYTDNVVDILANAQQEDLGRYLHFLPPQKAAEIREMLHYQDKTAGAIMATEFVSILGNQTVKSAMHVLKIQAKQAETIYYVYVVDQAEQLIGIVTLRDLLTASDNALISEIMSSQVISTRVDTDQEEVAQTIRDYNFLALPVVDFDNKLIGIITVDDVIDVIDEESAEDYSGLAGVDIDENPDNPVMAAIKRLPWLITLLFLGMSTASLISHYESLVSEASILAVFISSITGTAGNAGTQSLAVAVRRLADKDADHRGLLRIIFSELLTGLLIGLITGTTIMIIVGIWKQNFILGIVIGLAMMCAIIVANLAGALIPMLMNRLGVDPAVASGPFISTLSDLTSVLIYFNIAQMFLRFILKQ